MSVVNEFGARNIKYSIAERRVCIMDEHDHKSTFKFTIHCRMTKEPFMYFFFDQDKHQCLVAKRAFLLGGFKYECKLMRFWLEGEMPVLSVNLWVNQTEIMGNIGDQFKEQYASFVLDGIINQD